MLASVRSGGLQEGAARHAERRFVVAQAVNRREFSNSSHRSIDSHDK